MNHGRVCSNSVRSMDGCSTGKTSEIGSACGGGKTRSNLLLCVSSLVQNKARACDACDGPQTWNLYGIPPHMPCFAGPAHANQSGSTPPEAFTAFVGWRRSMSAVMRAAVHATVGAGARQQQGTDGTSTAHQVPAARKVLARCAVHCKPLHMRLCVCMCARARLCRVPV